MPGSNELLTNNRIRQTLALLESGEVNSMSELADRLGVSTETLRRDKLAILEDAKELRLQLAEYYLDFQITRINLAIGAIWPRVMAGDLFAHDRLIRYITLQSKLLGLVEGQPTNHETRILIQFPGLPAASRDDSITVIPEEIE